MMVVTALLIGADLMSAHEMKMVGPFHLMIGWGDEPAFSGLKNSVEVDISDAGGMPVVDIGGSLAAEVVFGEARFTSPLLPVRDRPGKFRAWLVPTRAGTYAFRITGNVRGQPVDVTSTCSSKSFACVEDVSEVFFPAKDPSTGQLAALVDRSLPRAERASQEAATARVMAIGSLVVAMLALVVTFRPRGSKAVRDR
jgi:hypothetical protein